jgi:hypothetical protein
MTRRAAQLNIRSDTARQRVADLVRETGKTATQVVEEALQSYRPPPPVERPPAPDGLEWRGRFLVEKDRGGPSISTEELLRRIDEARDDRIRHIMGEEVD